MFEWKKRYITLLAEYGELSTKHKTTEDSREYFRGQLYEQKEANFVLETALRDMTTRYNMLELFFKQLNISVKLPARKQ
jgi:hypothetical protein